MTEEKEKGGLIIKSDKIGTRFVAQASIGPEVSATGFILQEGGEWISAEATYLYGILEWKENEKLKELESLQPVLFYNSITHEALERGVKLSDGSFFKLGQRVIRPHSKTLGTSGLETFMSKEAGERFLGGEVVELDDCYPSVIAGIKRFYNLDWDPRLYDVVACITISSYFYDLFGAFPIVMLGGPFESGKTRLLLCILYMGHRGMPLIDLTEATTFRTAEAWKALLGIDEAWNLSPEIERLLRGSYKKGMRVPRMEKGKGEQQLLGLYDLFSKVVVASDQPFPPNIVSKGILLQLRKMPDPNPEKRDPVPWDFVEERTKGYIFRLTHGPQVAKCAEELDKLDIGLSGRDYEVWKLALTIASMKGGEVWENVLSYARESCEEKRAESYEELHAVLEAIYGLIQDKGGKFPITFTPKEIHDTIWERQKGDYRVTKQKQEIDGEDPEKYDYDTQRFERVYNVIKIGKTYLRQLSLKGQQKRTGTHYALSDQKQFHDLVVRYHPALPKQEEEYGDLILSQKLLNYRGEGDV